MKTTALPDQSARVTVENIGGIDSEVVDLAPGVNVLRGQNATNRTSFLRAIMAVLGSDRASLKGDADAGRVELRLGDDTYTRELARRGSTVAFSGNPYLSDPTAADLFAFLLENNDARRAVERQDDLREIIMEPIDTDAIQQRLAELRTEKRDLDQRLEELESLESKLTSLTEERTRLEREIEAKREQLATKRRERERHDVDAATAEQSVEEEHLDDLYDARSELETVRSRIATQRESVESLRDRKTELEAELDDLPTSVREISEVGTRIGELQERKRQLTSTVDRLQNLIQFNEGMLDGDHDLHDALAGDATDGHLTDQLLGDGIVCWTCGSDVEAAAIEETLDRLRDVRKEKVSERSKVSSELEDVRRKRKEIEKKQKQRDRVEHEHERVETQLKRQKSELEDLESRRDDLKERVNELEAEIDEIRQEGRDEALDIQQDVSELEFELDSLESDLDTVEEDIEEVTEKIDERAELETRRDAVRDELTELRTRIETIESEAVDAFNEHMADVLGVLEYDNIARIWIERTEETVREGRRTVQRSLFELHVVRETEAGTTYEDAVEHLSESEREVTGLVFALAGYLVHDVYETVPFMLLDSLEAIDSERIARLVDYLREYAPYLVVALLPEDANALNDDYGYVSY